MSTAVAEASAPVARRGWYRRNWKWFTPLVVLLVVVGGGVASSWDLIWPRFHPLYHLSLEKVSENPKVIEKLGEPIKPVRFFAHGSVNSSGDRGDASFIFDVAGPKGTAAVSSKLRQLNGDWGFSQLELTFADNERIDIAQSIDAGGADDTPKFNPFATPEPMNPPDLPRNIPTGPMDISIDLPPGAQ